MPRHIAISTGFRIRRGCIRQGCSPLSGSDEDGRGVTLELVLLVLTDTWPNDPMTL